MYRVRILCTHSTFHVPRSMFHTLHFPLSIPHSILHIIAASAFKHAYSTFTALQFSFHYIHIHIRIQIFTFITLYYSLFHRSIDITQLNPNATHSHSYLQSRFSTAYKEKRQISPGTCTSITITKVKQKTKSTLTGRRSLHQDKKTKTMM